MIKINGFSSSARAPREASFRCARSSKIASKNIVNFSIKIDDYGLKAISLHFFGNRHRVCCLLCASSIIKSNEMFIVD